MSINWINNRANTLYSTHNLATPPSRAAFEWKDICLGALSVATLGWHITSMPLFATKAGSSAWGQMCYHQTMVFPVSEKKAYVTFPYPQIQKMIFFLSSKIQYMSQRHLKISFKYFWCKDKKNFINYVLLYLNQISTSLENAE